MSIQSDVYKRSDNENLSRSIKKAMSKLLPICFVALLISALVCSVANDMYAFVKKDNEVNLNVYQSVSLNEMTDILSNRGVINNPDVFKLYVKLKDKKNTIEEFTGEATLNSSMSYREILSAFS